MAKLFLMIFGILSLTACGGGGQDPCDPITWDVRVTDSTGTYVMRCREFQCPGFKPERSCFRI